MIIPLGESAGKSQLRKISTFSVRDYQKVTNSLKKITLDGEMNQSFDPSMPLIMGLQPTASSLPYKMNYTCYTWMTGSGVFSKENCKYEELIAAGTKQGAIVIFGVSGPSIRHMGLLCGHQFEVTDIHENLHHDALLSVSADGTICGWSCADGSCIFRLKEFHRSSGQYRIVLCPTNTNLIWLWCPGASIELIDVYNGKTLLRMKKYGLMSFSVISPHMSALVKEETLICVELMKIEIYHCVDDYKLEKVREYQVPYSCPVRIQATDGGLVSCEGNYWAILRPSDGAEIIRGEVPNEIASINWSKRGKLIIGTYNAEFHVITLKYDKHSLSITGQSVWKAPDAFLLDRFAFDESMGIVFTRGYKNLVRLKGNEVSTIVDNNCEVSRCYSMLPGVTNCTVIQQIGDSTVEQINWFTGVSEKKWEFPGKITALNCRILVENVKRKQVVAGFDDGSVSFMMDDGHTAPVVVAALPSPIIALAYPPQLINAHLPLLAVGKSGACALFRSCELIATFNDSPFPVTSVYYSTSSDMFCIGYMDGSYILYDLMGKMVDWLSSPPPGCEEIWSVMYKVLIDRFIGTCIMVFKQTSLFFETIEVSKLHHEWKEMHEIHSSIIDFLEREVVNSNSTSSFVLLGSELIPTMFYKPFKVNEDLIIQASPLVASSHFVQYELLGEMLNIEFFEKQEEKYGPHISNMLPILSEMLFSPNVSIRSIVARVCAHQINHVRFAKAQAVLSRYAHFEGPSNFRASEKFLLSLLVVGARSSLPPSFLPTLLEFLIKVTSTESWYGVLGLSILLHGFSIWQEVSNIHLVDHIVKSVTLQSVGRYIIEPIFFKHIYSHMPVFLQSMTRMMGEIVRSGDNVDERARKLLNTYSSAIAANAEADNISNISVAIAGLYTGYPILRTLILEIMMLQAATIRTVDVQGDKFVIGTSDGSIYAYSGGELVLREVVLDGAISLVSIGPHGRFCFVGSFQSFHAAVVSLNPKSTKKRKSSIIEYIDPGIEMEFEPCWVSDSKVQLQMIA